MKGNNSLYNVLYKTTCIVTGRVYVGVHSTLKLEDGYIGCGIVADYSSFENDYKSLIADTFGNAVRKFGVKSFVREDLLFFDSVDEALRAEREVVDSAWIKDIRTYNKVLGRTKPPRKVGKENGNWGRKWTVEKREAFSKKRRESEASKGAKNPNVKPCFFVNCLTLEVHYFGSFWEAHAVKFPTKNVETIRTMYREKRLFDRHWVILDYKEYTENKENLKVIVQEYINQSRFCKQLNLQKEWAI